MQSETERVLALLRWLREHGEYAKWRRRNDR
jgi:hypothetical protein